MVRGVASRVAVRAAAAARTSLSAYRPAAAHADESLDQLTPWHQQQKRCLNVHEYQVICPLPCGSEPCFCSCVVNEYCGRSLGV